MPNSKQVLGTQWQARDTGCHHLGPSNLARKTDIKGFISMVLSLGNLSSGTHLAMCRDIFGCHSWAGGATGHE